MTDTAVDIDTLVVGFTEYGLAGLTAVDSLSDRIEMRQAGHLVVRGPPTITPFEKGVPRHHTRLYVDERHSLGVVAGERIVSVDAVSDLADHLDTEHLTVLTRVLGYIQSVGV